MIGMRKTRIIGWMVITIGKETEWQLAIIPIGNFIPPIRRIWTWARQQLGFTSGDAFLNGVLYSIMIYGTKYVQQGTKQVTGLGGTFTVPNMVAQPGIYGILRWYSRTPFPPAGMNIPPRITIIPIPADSPYVFAPG
jgi:hypothetical protein